MASDDSDSDLWAFPLPSCEPASLAAPGPTQVGGGSPDQNWLLESRQDLAGTDSVLDLFAAAEAPAPQFSGPDAMPNRVCIDEVVSDGEDFWLGHGMEPATENPSPALTLAVPVPTAGVFSKRGRPPSTLGSRTLREAQKAAQAEADALEEECGPIAGSIAYARSVRLARLASKRKALTEESGVLPVKNIPEASLQNVPLLAAKSPIWATLSQIGGPLSRMVAHSAHFAFEEIEKEGRALDERTDPVLPLLFEPNRNYISDSQLAKTTGRASSHLREFLDQAAAATLIAAGGLWGTMFDAICKKIECGDWQPILFIRKCRYDETPSRLRLSSQGKGLADATEENARFAKAFQFELSFHCLMKDERTKKYLHLSGNMPTPLTVCDRTTGECTKAVILKHLAAVPELQRVAKFFAARLQLSTVDRYAANFRAERSVQHDEEETWHRCTMPCNIHRLAQVSTVTAKLMDRDVSGLIATSLSFDSSGALHKLRNILRQIFSEELCIYYSAPPDPSHRAAVYDVLLPVRSTSAEEQEQGSKRMPRKHDLLRLVQRCVLDATLNGNIQAEEVQHFCSFGCCESVQDTHYKFAHHTAWALLPHKLPRFPRTRWSNREASVCWSALLGAHHFLLLRVIEKFSGGPRVVKPALQTQPEEQDQEINADLDDLLNFGDVGIRNLSIPIADEVPPPADAVGGDEQVTDRVGDDVNQALGEALLLGELLDWQELNKQYGVKSVAWVNSNPLPRLLLFQIVSKPVQDMMHKMLYLSGKEWEKHQTHLAAKGLQRSYRIIEAANPVAFRNFHDEICRHGVFFLGGLSFFVLLSSIPADIVVNSKLYIVCYSNSIVNNLTSIRISKYSI